MWALGEARRYKGRWRSASGSPWHRDEITCSISASSAGAVMNMRTCWRLIAAGYLQTQIITNQSLREPMWQISCHILEIIPLHHLSIHTQLNLAHFKSILLWKGTISKGKRFWSFKNWLYFFLLSWSKVICFFKKQLQKNKLRNIFKSTSCGYICIPSFALFH